MTFLPGLNFFGKSVDGQASKSLTKVEDSTSVSLPSTM